MLMFHSSHNYTFPTQYASVNYTNISPHHHQREKTQSRARHKICIAPKACSIAQVKTYTPFASCLKKGNPVKSMGVPSPIWSHQCFDTVQCQWVSQSSVSSPLSTAHGSGHTKPFRNTWLVAFVLYSPLKVTDQEYRNSLTDAYICITAITI